MLTTKAFADVSAALDAFERALPPPEILANFAKMSEVALSALPPPETLANFAKMASEVTRHLSSVADRAELERRTLPARARATAAWLLANFAKRTLPARARATAARLENSGFTGSAEFFERAAAHLEDDASEYDYSLAIHFAVGAAEEVARTIAHKSTATLDTAVRLLVGRGQIDRRAAERLRIAYVIRNQTPGAGHGAGGCPREIAATALLRSIQGIEALLDAGGMRDAPTSHTPR